MTIYFCDTSAIIKLYHTEAGTEWMDNIFNDKQLEISISELTTIEFYSAVNKKVRTGEITISAKDTAIQNFMKDCHNRFVVTPLNTAILKQAGEIINKYGDKFSIRTLDALQLAACQEDNFGEIKFVCADTNLIRICNFEGIDGVNPETEAIATMLDEKIEKKEV
jgi:uncharacterized protein